MRNIFLHGICGLTVAASLALVAGCGRETPVASPDSRLGATTGIVAQGEAMRGSNAYCGSEMSLAPGISGPALNDIASFETVYSTDFVVAGVGGMRNIGSATLAVAGITGPVTEAYLFWNGPSNDTSPTANANVMVNGNPVVGANIGFSHDNCWGYDHSQSYRADVTGIVSAAGNGNYALAGFGAGEVNTNGASIIVFFNDGNPANNRDVVIYEGNDSNIPNSYDADGWNLFLSGVNYTAGLASIQLHVADGQDFGPSNDDALVLNAAVLEPVGQIFEGNSVPSANNGPDNNGSLWDIRRWDITSFLSPGPNNLTLTTGSRIDCLGLVVAVVDLPAGSAPSAESFFTGGGFLGEGKEKVNFGFNAGPREMGGEVKGQLQVTDHATKKKIHGTTVETYSVSGDCATFSGSCKVNNVAGYTYAVRTCDIAEPGKDADAFALIVWDASDVVVCSYAGIIAGGNVQKHDLLFAVAP
jgi:hypothetical protein